MTRLLRSWHTARVFISSTFRDMQAERDHLVRVVFPALRERLERHRVSLIDIDLRWGVTRAQAENDQALGLCLQQVDECRPFFLGLLGERYGWVPEQIPAATLAVHPWLLDCSGCSVTELEMRHGALNARTNARALFAFRDSAATHGIPEPLRSAVYVEHELAAARRLEELKSHIRASGLPLLDSYPCRWDSLIHDRVNQVQGRLVGLEAFGERVGNWLWEAIQEELNISEQLHADVADADGEEADAHERFLESRLRVYAGREDVQRVLLAHVGGHESAPCVLTGPAGAGKSAALASFALLCRRQTGTEVFVHFTGSAPRSTSLRQLLRRLCLFLQRASGWTEDVPDEPDALARQFQESLARLPATRRLILVLDALDQLDPADQAHQLHWLPGHLPAQVRVVLSCAEEAGSRAPVLAALARRACIPVRIGPLGDAERRQIVHEVPSLAAKTLDEAQLDLLLSNPATTNPLFLRVALEELRGFGSYEQLSERIAGLPRGDDAATALFDQVLERLEQDFDAKLVRGVLVPLASARRGLSERELQQLTAESPAADDLFPVLRQLRPYLLSRSGLTDFYHRNLLEAVRQRYLLAMQAQRDAHVQLADHFSRSPLEARSVDELPWHLAEAAEWPRLFALLADLAFFDAVWQASPFEVKALWARVEAASPLRLVDAYRPLVNDPAQSTPDIVGRVASLLSDTGHPAEALTLRGHLVAHLRQAGDRDGLAAALSSQALLLKGRGDQDTALKLLGEAEALAREHGDRHCLQTVLGNQARILKSMGDLDGAASRLHEAELICRDLDNRHGLQIALGSRALVLYARGDLDGAEVLLRERERICRETGNSHGLQIALANLALLAQARGDLDGALVVLEESERICREVGNRHGLQVVLASRARALQERGDLTGALALLGESERICRELDNPLGLQITLSTRALVLQASGDVAGALALHQEAERMCRQLRNPEGLALTLHRQAELLSQQDQPGEALRLAEEALRVAEDHGLGGLAERIRRLLATLTTPGK